MIRKFLDWLVQSKAWQLRVVVALLVIPFIALAFLVKGLVITYWMVACAAILIFSAPKIRTQMLAIPTEQAVIGLIMIVASLVLVVYFPLISLWGLKINNGAFMLLAAMRMMSRPMKFPTMPTVRTVHPRKKKENKKQRSRRLKGNK